MPASSFVTTVELITGWSESICHRLRTATELENLDANEENRSKSHSTLQSDQKSKYVQFRCIFGRIFIFIPSKKHVSGVNDSCDADYARIACVFSSFRA